MSSPVENDQNFSVVPYIRKFFMSMAFLFALLPSVLKMYETSHWFREGDPSVYDNAKDWFKNPALPFQKQIDNPKVLMRVYFFILPYIAMTVMLVAAHMLPKKRRGSKAVLTPYKSHPGRIFLRSIPLPRFLVSIGAPESVSVGEIIGVCVFLFINFLTVGVRIRRSLPRGSRKNHYLAAGGDAGKETIDPFSMEAVEVWGKTLGVISIVNLGWYLMMPVGRKSVLLEALGMSWDRAIKYHRWVGFYSIAIMVVHSLMYVMVIIHGNGDSEYDPDGVMIKHNLLAWGCNGEDECDADQRLMLRINVYGIICMLLILVMTLFALPYFRRQKFEWFYYAHHLFVLVLVFVCLHYSGAIIYLIPGVAIYSIDKFMGLRLNQKAPVAKTELVSSDVLECNFKLGKNVQYKAGQYVFVNVPSVSYLEWHPYSLTSSPNANPDNLFFHVKEAGEPNSWTRKVVEAGKNGSLPMRIDAFYGDYSKELENKKAVVLVGGGIGVTPMISLGMDLVASDPDLPVTIMWVCKTLQEFEIFSTQLSHACQCYPNLTVKAWVTFSLPEDRIKKADIQSLVLDEEKVDMVMGVLKPPRTNTEDELSPGNNYLFVKDSPGLESLSNALSMLLAMVLGLTAYTTTKDLEKEKEIVEDKWTLVQIMLVMDLVWLAFFITYLIRLAHNRGFFGSMSGVQNQGKQGKKGSVKEVEHLDTTVNETMYASLRGKKYPFPEKINTPGSTQDLYLSETNTFSESKDSYNIAADSNATDRSSDIETGSKGSSVDTDVLRSMLEGRIGRRPDMEAEFKALAELHKGEDTKTIGVLACGPRPMTQAINQAVHNEGSMSTFFNAGKIKNEDGTDATFAFIEEDWEW